METTEELRRIGGGQLYWGQIDKKILGNTRGMGCFEGINEGIREAQEILGA